MRSCSLKPLSFSFSKWSLYYNSWTSRWAIFPRKATLFTWALAIPSLADDNSTTISVALFRRPSEKDLSICNTRNFSLYINSEYYYEKSWHIFNLDTKHHPIDWPFKPNDCLFNPTKRLVLLTNQLLTSPSHCHFSSKRFPVTGLLNRLPLYSKQLPLSLGYNHQSIA